MKSDQPIPPARRPRKNRQKEDSTARRPAGKLPSKLATRQRTAAEHKVCGFHACLGIFERRPEDIIRVYLTDDRTRHVSELLKWCAAHRRAYNIVEASNLERLTGSSHHEGIMILARKPVALDDAGLLLAIREQTLRGPFLYLDGLQNPHNLGALLRTSAHFGVSAILGQAGDLPDVSSASARVAEGGAEHVAVLGLQDPQEVLSRMKEAGFVILATSSHQGQSLYQEQLSSRTVFVLGGEQSGVSIELLRIADRCLQIPGTSLVESLNVSVAGAVLLSECYRQQSISPGHRSTVKEPASPSLSRPRTRSNRSSPPGSSPTNR